MPRLPPPRPYTPLISEEPGFAQRVGVVATVEVQGADVCEQAASFNRIERRSEELLVAAVGAIGGPRS
jgi:hypothetical protein